MLGISMSRRRMRGYVAIGVLLMVWASILVALAVTVMPDAYWYSYFAVDYTFGFVRRGLAGELVGLFPGSSYFTAVSVLRWVPTVFFLAGLGGVAWSVANKSERSERRLMLVLLIPVLPFGFMFALFSARTDLIGAAALMLFAVTLTRMRSDRSAIAASFAYGFATAVLALIHEAIPFLYALGAIAALTVLVPSLGSKSLSIAIGAAVGPGVASSLAVAVFGSRGLSPQLCQLVPNGPINHPLAGKPSAGELLRGFHYYIDYHDWMCRSILPLFDQSFADAVRFVGSLGTVALLASTACGLAVFVVTMLAISHVSGVPVRHMRDVIKRRPLAMLIGLCLITPIFMTGVDWIRWWVIITFDIGVVMLLFVSAQPEADLPPTRRALRIFALFVALLAVIPVGIVPGLAPVPM